MNWWIGSPRMLAEVGQSVKECEIVVRCPLVVQDDFVITTRQVARCEAALLHL